MTNDNSQTPFDGRRGENTPFQRGETTPFPDGAYNPSEGSSGRDQQHPYYSEYGQAPMPGSSPFAPLPAGSQAHASASSASATPPPFGTQQGAYPDYQSQPGGQPWGYAPMSQSTLQQPRKPRQRWSTSLLGLTASLSLILGGIIGLQLDNIFGGDAASGPTQTQDSQPRQDPQLNPGGNDQQEDEPADPGQQNSPSTGLDSGTVVDSAPGVVLVNTTLFNGAGAGTGMILDSDGLVLTNYHVVSGSETVQLTLADTGEEYTAQVLGHDATHDVAVLQIEGAEDLPTVSTNTDDLQMGDAVSAVGNGSGQGYLTQLDGSITGLNETITASDAASPTDGEVLTGLIATDADVVPGYSGGPLFNSDGEVVGITTAASRGNTSDQVNGYAIPVSTALDIADQVVSGNPTSDTVIIGRNAALGVTVASGNTPGALIVEVLEGSAADEAGIVADETVVALNGTAITDPSMRSGLVKEHRIGDVVTLTVVGPDGGQRDVQVTLAESTVN